MTPDRFLTDLDQSLIIDFAYPVVFNSFPSFPQIVCYMVTIKHRDQCRLQVENIKAQVQVSRRQRLNAGPGAAVNRSGGGVIRSSTVSRAPRLSGGDDLPGSRGAPAASDGSGTERGAMAAGGRGSRGRRPSTTGGGSHRRTLSTGSDSGGLGGPLSGAGLSSPDLSSILPPPPKSQSAARQPMLSSRSSAPDGLGVIDATGPSGGGVGLSSRPPLPRPRNPSPSRIIEQEGY